MAEQIFWLDGRVRDPRIIEKICPGRHVGQKQWQSAWEEEHFTFYGGYCKDFISDYESIFNYPMEHEGNQLFRDDQQRWQILQAFKEQGTHVPITNLAHFTNPKAAKQIVDENGFRGGQKKINEDDEGNDVKASFSWWSPIFTVEERKKVADHLGKAIKPFLGKEDNISNFKDRFATSNAFLPQLWRYGDRLFQYGIDELCQYYGEQVGGELRFKVLGTFAYKGEVMHAVLVCSQADGAGQFAAYPGVLSPTEDVNNESVITRDDMGNWVWKPQATGGTIRRLKGLEKYPLDRRWENVAFAFHIPDDKDMIMAGNPADHQKIMDVCGRPVESIMC